MSRELRPAKRLVNSNFEGYKLDPNGLKQTSKPLVTKVHHVKRDPNKFTFNYIKQQLMHNNLFYNQWDDSVYFVDENYNVTLIEKRNVSVVVKMIVISWFVFCSIFLRCESVIFKEDIEIRSGLLTG